MKRLKGTHLKEAVALREQLYFLCDSAYKALRYVDEEGDHDDHAMLAEALAELDGLMDRLGDAKVDLISLISRASHPQQPKEGAGHE